MGFESRNLHRKKVDKNTNSVQVCSTENSILAVTTTVWEIMRYETVNKNDRQTFF